MNDGHFEEDYIKAHNQVVFLNEATGREVLVVGRIAMTLSLSSLPITAFLSFRANLEHGREELSSDELRGVLW